MGRGEEEVLAVSWRWAAQVPARDVSPFRLTAGRHVPNKCHLMTTGVTVPWDLIASATLCMLTSHH